MVSKRVVLLSNRSLLATGVQRLLQEVSDIELLVLLANEPEAIAKMGQPAPVAIIMDLDDTSFNEGIITRLLEQCPRTRIIALSSKETGINVYCMKRVLYANLDSLLQVIKGRGKAARRKHGRQAREVIG